MNLASDTSKRSVTRARAGTWRSAARVAGLAMLLLALGVVGGRREARAQANFTSSSDEQIPKVLATFDVRTQPAAARPGEHVRVLITAHLARGWYTYSLVPSKDELAPPPTRIDVEAGNLVKEGPVYETNPVFKHDKVFGVPLAFHPNAARFYQNLRIPANEAPARIPIAVRVHYQVCNNKFCTPPHTETFHTQLRVEAGAVRPAFAFMQRTVATVNPDGTLALDSSTLEGALAHGLLGFLLFAAGYGLLALLTPCVFPMIPVTVSFFMSASERDRVSVHRLALLFAAGIVLSATGLGLALTLVLGATGVSQFATSPWVNLAVALFFVGFAAVLLGATEVSLPDGVVNRVNHLSNTVRGPVGVVLMGVAFAATSFTCTMPFVGSLLVAATQGQVFWPVLGMLVYSAVFAFPFFLLALFPRYVMRLRGQAGNWLVQVKVVLGLLELGAALKFVSNADVIWRWGVFDRSVVLALWALLALLCALVLLGFVPWPGVRVQRRGPLRLALGAVFLLVAAYTASGLTGRQLNSFTESYLPPPLEVDAKAAVRLPGVDYVDAGSMQGLTWHRSLAEGLAEAKHSGKPVFIDFTGYTCVNCRWMEKAIFSAKPVYQSFRDGFVLVRLYTDGGPHGEENQNLEVQRFRTLALPYYVVLSPDNAVLAQHAGIVPTPAAFLDFLQSGRRRLMASAAASK